MGRHEDRLRPNNPWVPAGSGPGLKLCRLYEGRAGLVLKKTLLANPHDRILSPIRPSI